MAIPLPAMPWATVLFTATLMLAGSGPGGMVTSTTAGGAVPLEPAAAISVRLFDTVGLPQHTLDMVRATAEAALRPAGIAVAWSAPTGGPAAGCCQCGIVVRIIDEHADASCGFSVAEAGQRGFVSVAHACAARAAQRRAWRRNASVPMGRLLGYILAHEIAHVLLPEATHSRTGIFKASLQGSDWVAIRRGRLAFAADDLARLRAAAVAVSPPAGPPRPGGTE